MADIWDVTKSEIGKDDGKTLEKHAKMVGEISKGVNPESYIESVIMRSLMMAYYMGQSRAYGDAIKEIRHEEVVI